MSLRHALGVGLAILAIGVMLLARDDSPSSAAPTIGSSASTTVVLVRHAEKADDGTSDPPLTDAGRERARALADALDEAGVTTIYSTPYRRTQQTAAPVADRLGVDVATFEIEGGAEGYARAQARRVLEAHPGETVLVVSHSNTVPLLVEALGAPTIASIEDEEYDRFVLVTVQPDGAAHVLETRYGAPSPAAVAAMDG